MSSDGSPVSEAPQNGSGLPPGRLRVSRACHPCNISKRKCDGQVPCSYCISHQRECTLSAEPAKKRGPPKGTPRGKPKAAGLDTGTSASVGKKSAAPVSKTTGSVSVGSKRKRSQGPSMIPNGSDGPAERPDTAIAQGGTKKPRLQVVGAVDAVSEPALPLGAQGKRKPGGSNKVATVAAVEKQQEKMQSGNTHKAVLEHGEPAATSDAGVAEALAELSKAVASSLAGTTGTTGIAAPMASHGSSSSSSMSTSMQAKSRDAQPWDPPAPVNPTTSEMAVIDSFFGVFNKAVFPAVDEQRYRQALAQASISVDAFEGDSDMNSESYSSSSSASTAASSKRKKAHALSAAQKVSEAFGFRVLHHMLLSVGYKMQGRLNMAQCHYGLARAYLAPCVEYPSVHLVSALLLMVAITRALHFYPSVAAISVSLAMKLLQVVEMPAEIKLNAEMLAATMTPEGSPEFPAATVPGEGVSWPAIAAPAGVSWSKRLGQLFGFFKRQLVDDFTSVTSSRLTAFLQLLDESDSLREQHGVFKHIPYDALKYAFLALVHRKFNQQAEAVLYSRAAIETALGDPLSTHTFSCVLAISKIISFLDSISNTLSSSERAAVHALREKASAWVIASPSWGHTGRTANLAGKVNAGRTSLAVASTSSSSSSSEPDAPLSSSSSSSSSLSSATASSLEATSSFSAYAKAHKAALRAKLLEAATSAATDGGVETKKKEDSFTLLNGFAVPTGPSALLPLEEEQEEEEDGGSGASATAGRASGPRCQRTANGAAGDDDDNDSILGTRAARRRGAGQPSAGRALTSGSSVDLFPGAFDLPSPSTNAVGVGGGGSMQLAFDFPSLLNQAFPPLSMLSEPQQQGSQAHAFSMQTGAAVAMTASSSSSSSSGAASINLVMGSAPLPAALSSLPPPGFWAAGTARGTSDGSFMGLLSLPGGGEF
jgi:Fungal Zn(2)-Cys(6) binuclear cluster domain